MPEEKKRKSNNPGPTKDVKIQKNSLISISGSDNKFHNNEVKTGVANFGDGTINNVSVNNPSSSYPVNIGENIGVHVRDPLLENTEQENMRKGGRHEQTEKRKRPENDLDGSDSDSASLTKRKVEESITDSAAPNINFGGNIGNNVTINFTDVGNKGDRTDVGNKGDRNTITFNGQVIFDRITDDQKEFLRKANAKRRNENLEAEITLADAKNILIVNTAIKAVCMIGIPKPITIPKNPKITGLGTGFLATMWDEGVKKVCFLSAGHNFLMDNDPFWNADNEKEIFQHLNNFMIHFGNLDGHRPSISDRDLTKGEPMSLGKFLRYFKFYGSMSFEGRRKVFKKVQHGWQIINVPSSKRPNEKVNQMEDYCALCVDDKDTEKKFADLGLSMLDCGEGDYLDCKPNSLACIVGHPVKNATEKDATNPLRFSFGQETFVKDPDRLLFDYDSTAGNSGSPVIGRGEKCSQGGDEQAYKVKGIHVQGFKGSHNGAQKIKDLGKWINYGK